MSRVPRCRRWWAALLFSSLGCGPGEWNGTVTVWHPMTPDERRVLEASVGEFEATHPDLSVDLLFKGPEELRSSFQSAAIAGSGPDLVFGPADQVGPFVEMGVIAPLDDLLFDGETADFVPEALIQIDGRLVQWAPEVGNHLALVYNRELVAEAPGTMSELIELARVHTVDLNDDGRMDRWGLVWHQTEPFFLVPFLGAFGGSVMADDGTPALDGDPMRRALEFVLELRDVHRVVPPECDYDIADGLFKEGRAAFLVNGPWSWAGYERAGIDVGIARIPVLDETGLWPTPMVSARGYSLNANLGPGPRRDAALALLRHLVGAQTQARFARHLAAIPTRRSLRREFLDGSNPLLEASIRQAEVGVPMPVIAEMRAVWDGMRPVLQGVLGGAISVTDAGEKMQKQAERGIAEMREGESETGSGAALLSVVVILVLGGIWAAWKTICDFVMPVLQAEPGRRRDDMRFAFGMIGPACCLLMGVVAYPFFTNAMISLSNMSMGSIRDWQIVGFLQYAKVFQDPAFYQVLGTTLMWTSSNVVLHVLIGAGLALVLQGMRFGRVYKAMLILPWAVPQYITALTWRGEFNAEYGAVNLLLGRIGIAPVTWLSGEGSTFAACLITNVWLGFPFMMMIALGALQSAPRDLYDAAKIDGAGPWERLIHVTIPLLRPVMWPAITLGIVWTFNNLNVVWLVSNGGEPGDHTHILVTYVYKAAFNLYRYGYAAALSMVIFVILAIVGTRMLKRGVLDAEVAR